jgi:hypothetical protein
VFEPALQHLNNAFRWGAPAFEDEILNERWSRARRRVMFHLLRRVADSPWAKHLILRGSVVLQAWLGDNARDPGDLDWVVDPPTLTMNSPLSGELLPGVIFACCDANDAGILANQVVTEDIWTYDRAPGRRIVFPWQVPGLPKGTVQMDFVFGENFPSATIWIPIANEDGTTSQVEAASAEQSLAWKLLWLHTDIHPQGKDLYDAVLLAEHVKKLPMDLLQQTLATANLGPRHHLTLDSPMKWRVDWENFLLEYPKVPGTVESWKQRLINALAPTFAPVSAKE